MGDHRKKVSTGGAPLHPAERLLLLIAGTKLEREIELSVPPGYVMLSWP